ncbi:MAG TPA: hypothetical protein PLB63_01255 [Planctomycetota bacterium]|nr:hypothetical protein [Planctomycetota bacterium]HQB01174.1 hypothetical protein [Planctomycetota bacterium]
MKLHLKTYLNSILFTIIMSIGSIVITYFILVSLPGLDDAFTIITFSVLCIMVGVFFAIGGLILAVYFIIQMKKLKYFLENGIHAQAMMIKSHPLFRHKTSLEKLLEKLSREEKKSLDTETYSHFLQYQFKNKKDQIVTIDKKNTFNIFPHLTVGSKFHILYDAYDEKHAMICLEWEEWIAKHELDKYPRFITDAPLVGKQRHIPLFYCFSFMSLILIIVALMFIGMSFFVHIFLSNTQGFPENFPNWIYFVGYGTGFLLLYCSYAELKTERDFYEYAVRTVALVTSTQIETRTRVREIKYKSGTRTYTETYIVIIIEYQFLSSTENSLFQGSCELQDTPESRELKKGAEIEILYHVQKPHESRLFTSYDKKYIH